MTRHSNRSLALWPIYLAVVLVSCLPQSRFAAFDPIVTEDLIREGCEHDIPFEFAMSQTPTKRSYDATFLFGPEHPECSAYATITIARAGVLLDPERYEWHKRIVRNMDKDNPPDMRWAPYLLPNIGRKAIAGFALGSGGGGDFLVFTTSDGRFDVQIEQGNRLPEDMDGPGVLCEKIAREISRRYNTRTRNSPENHAAPQGRRPEE